MNFDKNKTYKDDLNNNRSQTIETSVPEQRRSTSTTNSENREATKAHLNDCRSDVIDSMQRPDKQMEHSASLSEMSMTEMDTTQPNGNASN